MKTTKTNAKRIKALTIKTVQKAVDREQKQPKRLMLTSRAKMPKTVKPAVDPVKSEIAQKAANKAWGNGKAVDQNVNPARLAALKAWQTRKANVKTKVDRIKQEQMFRNAALKAWETRRANA